MSSISAVIRRLKLSEVTVVVSTHFVVENLRLLGVSGRDEVLLKDIKNVEADVGQLDLNLLTVSLDELDVRLVTLRLLLLLDGGNNAPAGTTGTNDVLVSDAQEIALLDSQFDLQGSDSLHLCSPIDEE